jgi:hypothetical protein
MTIRMALREVWGTGSQSWSAGRAQEAPTPSPSRCGGSGATTSSSTPLVDGAWSDAYGRLDDSRDNGSIY